MKGRLTEPKWIALTCDPALLRALNSDFEELRKYRLERDITALPNVDLNSKTVNGEPVALFKLKPLTRDNSLKLQVGELFAETEIVRSHVIEFANYEDLCIKMDKDVGDVCLTKTSMDKMDDETIQELADYLRDAARGADGSAGRPFTLPDPWRGDRLRSLSLRVNRVALEKAAESTPSQNTETSSEDRDQV